MKMKWFGHENEKCFRHENEMFQGRIEILEVIRPRKLYRGTSDSNGTSINKDRTRKKNSSMKPRSTYAILVLANADEN